MKPHITIAQELRLGSDDPRAAKLRLAAGELQLWLTDYRPPLSVLEGLDEPHADRHDDAEYLRDLAAMLTVVAAAIERPALVNPGRLAAYQTAVREALALATYEACVKREADE